MFSAERSSISAQNRGAQPTMEKLYEMNVRPTLMEAAAPPAHEFLAAPRDCTGRYGNCSKSRGGRKNYLALVRKHAALAEKEVSARRTSIVEGTP